MLEKSKATLESENVSRHINWHSGSIIQCTVNKNINLKLIYSQVIAVPPRDTSKGINKLICLKIKGITVAENYLQLV
jgi:hypothetical protein